MILLPTRGRPESLERFLVAYKATMTELPVTIRIDNDDPRLDDYMKISRASWQHWIVGPRVGAVQGCNEIFRKFPHEPVYVGVGDDLVPKTEHWDTELAMAAGLWGVSFGDDLFGMGYAPDRFPVHPVIGGNLLRAVGWLSPPGFWHLFIDQIWGQIARALDCLHFCPEVIVEHLHFGNNKSPMDQTYRDHMVLGKGDYSLWSQWQASGDLEMIVKRVREAMAA